MKNRIVLHSTLTHPPYGLPVYIDDVKLDPKVSQKECWHKSDDFSVGYGGSGPHQLALAILYHVTGDKQLSLQYMHQFCVDFTSKWEENKVYEIDVNAWMQYQLAPNKDLS